MERSSVGGVMVGWIEELLVIIVGLLGLRIGVHLFFFFFQAEDGIRDVAVTRVQTCALPISEHLQDGDIFLRSLRRKNFDIPVLTVSTRGQIPGTDGYINKTTYQPEDIGKKITQL